ncbi:MAG: alkaline phosphatase family protein [Phycisphaerae bacterium]
MPTEHVVFLSVPGLRPGDITTTQTPTLHGWARRGGLAELVPTFPCVTSPVQATMLTGTPPADHGVIANGFFDRDRRDVAFWVARHDVVAGEPLWDAARRRRDCVSAVWHAQNIKGAGADYIVTPAPIHNPDGTTQPWCYAKPDGLYAELVGDLGHFPLHHYWGPLASIESTRWILQAAVWLAGRRRPHVQWVYVPHLDYAAQKFGPDSAQAADALVALDALLGDFADGIARAAAGADVAYLVAGEYAMTNVTGAVYPNRMLRDAGLLRVTQRDGAEYLDLVRSTAFAMVDHQFAHVYVSPPSREHIARTCDAFRGAAGVATVLARGGGPGGEADRTAVGLDHERSGDVILIADDDRWFAYYWWLDDAAAPPFARTVDIHNKPGYDPVELFFDDATKGIPLDASLVKGAHGVPATDPRHRTALVASMPVAGVSDGGTYRDTDVKRMVLDLLGA